MKAKTVLGLLFFAAAVVFFIIKGVAPLFAKTNPISFESAVNVDSEMYVDDTAYYGSDEYYRITHLIAVIPAGFDHYFLVSNEENTVVMVVRADESFADKFDSYGESAEGVRINGVLKSMDSDLRYEVGDLRNELSGTAQVGVRYIDTLSDRYGFFTIICIVVFIALGGWFLLLVRNNVASNSPMVKVMLAVLIANCLFGVHIMVML
ncbi:MAG: hypothetical protein ACI4KM_09190 [Oscillospiraceae bacterium]